MNEGIKVVGKNKLRRKENMFYNKDSVNRSHYPCLCEALRTVLFWGRVMAVFPVTALTKYHHKSKCKFAVSNGWMAYSCTIQAVHLIYVSVAFSYRLMCDSYAVPSGSAW